MLATLYTEFGGIDGLQRRNYIPYGLWFCQRAFLIDVCTSKLAV